MKLFDFSFDSRAENLAADEALLDGCEENDGEEILRFWESPEYFVVVGYANKIATEVDIAACEKNKIPILRRCSGGGTVLQGRGCLNYALILHIAEDSPFANISSANRFIMEQNLKAVEAASRKPQAGISISGHTDLAVDGKKFSGNSQRRRKNYLLFHGTFLLNFNLPLVAEYLRMPSQQPDYRNHRNHLDFLTNLDVSADEMKRAMKQIWNAVLPLENPPREAISKLAREKYATKEWNQKF